MRKLVSSGRSALLIQKTLRQTVLGEAWKTWPRQLGLAHTAFRYNYRPSWAASSGPDGQPLTAPPPVTIRSAGQWQAVPGVPA